MGGLVVWAVATRVAEELGAPFWVVLAAGLLLGALALLGIPVALGRPRMLSSLIGGVGGLVVLVGFLGQVSAPGVGVALGIYLPAAAVVVLLAWATNRYALPALSRFDREQDAARGR